MRTGLVSAVGLYMKLQSQADTDFKFCLLFSANNPSIWEVQTRGLQLKVTLSYFTV